MQNKLWRTLIRITNLRNDEVHFVVPGWNSEVTVKRPISIIPQEFHSHLKIGTRLFVRTNVGADFSGDLKFEDFELPDQNPPPIDVTYTV